MAAVAVPVPTTRSRHRTALIASADASFRERVSAVLSGLRWKVREAHGGAQAWDEAMDCLPQTMVVDSWLPDLNVDEFLREFQVSFPHVDVVANGGESVCESAPGPFRQEILYALRRAQDTDTAAWNTAPLLDGVEREHNLALVTARASSASAASNDNDAKVDDIATESALGTIVERSDAAMFERPSTQAAVSEQIPELVGKSPCMLEVSRRIRRVAARTTPVLIEGPTGSGKEVVAEALHRLSSRSRRPFVAINCAAIPEALLEAELFGHTRGAFTGAVQGRTGRIEAADGGTVFFDEIGEMPLALQAKLLRFVESGELQRVGDNGTVKVDVRILAATHQPLAQQTQSGGFRADLYYRLAVFLIRTPALSDHLEDLPLLVNHFLDKMGRTAAVKRIDEAAMAMLRVHSWPGNVRELEHVLERAAILAGDAPTLTIEDIDFGASVG